MPLVSILRRAATTATFAARGASRTTRLPVRHFATQRPLLDKQEAVSSFPQYWDVDSVHIDKLGLSTKDQTSLLYEVLRLNKLKQLSGKEPDDTMLKSCVESHGRRAMEILSATGPDANRLSVTRTSYAIEHADIELREQSNRMTKNGFWRQFEHPGKWLPYLLYFYVVPPDGKSLWAVMKEVDETEKAWTIYKGRWAEESAGSSL